MRKQITDIIQEEFYKLKQITAKFHNERIWIMKIF